MKYPITTFVHLDDAPDPDNNSIQVTRFQEPNANSTFIEARDTEPSMSHTPRLNRSAPENFAPNSVPQNAPVHTESKSGEHSSYSVGHISHIPRPPPCPSTYTIPSIGNSMSKTGATELDSEEDLFGMIKLKDNDVCYTSGTIEWVGRKRSFPINSGFKIINENTGQSNEPVPKKILRLDKTLTCDADKIMECDCADVLPTVNAIVDHLNALHEAVDLVDLRLNTLEDVVAKNGK